MKRLTSIFIGFLAFAFGGCKETPPAPPAPPIVGPTQHATPAVTLGAITPTTAAFSWKKVENADGYEYTIKREETTVVSQKVPDDETEAVAEGLESETSYTLALRALGNNEYEDSSWREISFTTRADEPEPPSHVAIPDKVLEKYLFDNGIDMDSDGIISFDEAAAFTAIEMGYDYAEDATDANTVKSLDGLQYFTALETLNLKFHRVTDAAPIEGLTNLRALNLGENPITALRLDQLGQLTDLRLYGTGISELNLSKTPEMTVLYLQRTALTDLDLSVLPKLENAYINEARLTSLRAVGLDNLVRLDAVKNQLTELTVADCAELTELHLNDNRLTSLSLSGLPKLMRLNVYANKLTAIDLTELPFLMWLFVFDNELGELDLSGNAALRELYASNNPVREIDLSIHENVEIVELQDMPVLELINLKNGYCSDWAEYYIVQGNTSLKKVIVDPGYELEYVSGLFKDRPEVSVVTE